MEKSKQQPSVAEVLKDKCIIIKLIGSVFIIWLIFTFALIAVKHYWFNQSGLISLSDFLTLGTTLATITLTVFGYIGYKDYWKQKKTEAVLGMIIYISTIISSETRHLEEGIIDFNSTLTLLGNEIAQPTSTEYTFDSNINVMKLEITNLLNEVYNFIHTNTRIWLSNIEKLKILSLGNENQTLYDSAESMEKLVTKLRLDLPLIYRNVRQIEIKYQKVKEEGPIDTSNGIPCQYLKDLITGVSHQDLTDFKRKIEKIYKEQLRTIS